MIMTNEVEVRMDHNQWGKLLEQKQRAPISIDSKTDLSPLILQEKGGVPRRKIKKV